MKKIINTMVVLFVMLFAVSVYAKGTNDDNGKITITNAVSGETYNVYEMLQLESWDEEKSAYSYTVAEGWAAFFAQTDVQAYIKLEAAGSGNNTTKVYARWVGDSNATRASELGDLARKYIEDNNISASKSAITADSDIVTFSGLNLGYYFVDSSLGTICTLNTTAKEVEVTDKNTTSIVPSKTVKNDDVNKQIGDVIEYTLTIDNVKGKSNVKASDKLSSGLTLNASSIKVYTNEVSDSTLVAKGNTTYSVNTTATDSYSFQITFNDSFVHSNNKIIIVYNATLNENAVSDGAGNDNKFFVSYGNGQSTSDDPAVVTVYTYSMTLSKTDGNNSLDGAKFKVYTSKTGGTALKFIDITTDSDATKVYRLALDTEEGIEEIEAGTAVIKGIKAGNYYLEETKAPEGYNKLAQRVEVEITEAKENAISTPIEVINTTGAVLPSTGGVGTVLFITIGSLLVAACGVALVTKFRISKEY